MTEQAPEQVGPEPSEDHQPQTGQERRDAHIREQLRGLESEADDEPG
jgi:hypothetical protein